MSKTRIHAIKIKKNDITYILTYTHIKNKTIKNNLQILLFFIFGPFFDLICNLISFRKLSFVAAKEKIVFFKHF